MPIFFRVNPQSYVERLSEQGEDEPYQVKACMPLAQVTSESVHSVARVDHSSGNDADVSPLETDETILSIVFNSSNLSIEAMMPNNVNDV